jgi:ketosteroid isomerase-like protein
MQELINAFVDQVWRSFEQGDSSVAGKYLEAQNVRTLQELYRTLGTGDYAAFRNWLADDVEMEIASTVNGPFHGRWRGADAVASAVQNNFAQIREMAPTIDEVVAQGESIVVVAREKGTFHSGEAYDVHWVQWFTFRGGKLVRFREVVGHLPSPLD